MTNWKKLGVRCLVITVSLIPSVARATELRVGAGAVCLEADDTMVIAGGIGPRRVNGQEGDLRTVAVVLEKTGVAKLAIVACDVLFTPRDLVDPALNEIETATGIPFAHVLVSATHTHSAPSVTRVHDYDRDPVFAKRLQDSIVQAVKLANSRLEGGDAQFYFHLGDEHTVGANSRQLLNDGMIYWIGAMDGFVRSTGPFDPQLPVMAFRATDHQFRAVLYNHSTHTIGSRQSNVRSPCFYGLAAQELEQELGGTVGFLEGASGSTHNITGVSAEEAVLRMKKAIRDALDHATPHPMDQLATIKRPFRFKSEMKGATNDQQPTP